MGVVAFSLKIELRPVEHERIVVVVDRLDAAVENKPHTRQSELRVEPREDLSARRGWNTGPGGVGYVWIVPNAIRGAETVHSLVRSPAVDCDLPRSGSRAVDLRQRSADPPRTRPRNHAQAPRCPPDPRP